MGFYWGECNPSFKYHTAKADGAPGSGGRETRRGHRSPLPLSRQPGDQRADPGSAAGGRRGGLEKSRTPGKIDSGASHPGPQLPRGTRWRWGEPCCSPGGCSPAASSDAAGLLRSQPAAAGGPEPARPGASNYFDTSNMYVSDITKEVRAWRSQGRSAGLSLSCRMCVTQSLFSARLIFNFLQTSLSLFFFFLCSESSNERPRGNTLLLCKMWTMCGNYLLRVQLQAPGEGLAEPGGGGDRGYVSLAFFSSPLKPNHVAVCMTVRFSDFLAGHMLCFFFFF